MFFNLALPKARPLASASLVALLLAGCGSLQTANEVDYRGAKPRESKGLEVPPDLITPQANSRFSVPASGVARQSDFQKAGGGLAAAGAAPASDSGVLPTSQKMSLEGVPGRRVLLVNEPADRLYPALRQFWLDQGFELAVEQPQLGLIETDWAENKAKLPQDFIRRTVGTLLDRIYDTGERDRFRTRLERRGAGQTEITIAHRGLVEIAKEGSGDARTTWTNRPSDPQLEDAFLRRIMQKLGASESESQSLIASGSKQPSLATLTRSAQGSAIDLREPFDDAWRRVGLAIDRLGMTIDDRDRAKGIYYVRYRDPSLETEKKSGLFGRLFASDEPTSAKLYQLQVQRAGDATTRVQVRSSTGTDVGKDPNADRMLVVLNEQFQ